MNTNSPEGGKKIPRGLAQMNKSTF